MKIKSMIHYSFIQAVFWMFFCCCYGFAVFYLEKKGFSALQIGFIIAVFGLLGTGGQSLFASLVDKGKISLKLSSITILILFLTSSILLFLIPNKLIQIIGFGLCIFCVNSLLPLINRAAFVFGDEDAINYGIARGLGSLSYAAMSFILGILTLKMGEKIIPLMIIILCIAMLLLFVKFPSVALKVEITNERKAFPIRKYLSFMIIWIAFILLLSAHNLENTFLLQICERAGGNSSTLGTALAVAAVCELPVMFACAFLLKKFSAINLMIIAAFGFLIRTVAYLFSVNLVILYIAQVLQFMAFAVYASVSVYYAQNEMSEEDKTSGQSFMGSCQTIGSVIGSLFGGFLLQRSGILSSLLFCTILCAAGAILSIISLSFRKTLTYN